MRRFRVCRAPNVPRSTTNSTPTLAKLHQVDYVARGLSDFGRPDGYFERQVARWIKQYRGAETEHIRGNGAADRGTARR